MSRFDFVRRSRKPLVHSFPVLALARRRGGAALPATVCLYLLLLMALTTVIHVWGDRWWLATLVLFAPRSLLFLPLIVLAPICLWYRPWLALTLLVGSLMIAVPLLGVCIPYPWTSRASHATLRVLSCNVFSGQFDQGKWYSLIDDCNPDVVALQEHMFVSPPLSWPKGWYVQRSQGLLIASRFPLTDIQVVRNEQAEWKPAIALLCTLELPTTHVRLANVHLHSPQRGIQVVLDRKTIIRPARSAVMDAETERRRYESLLVSDQVKRREELPQIVLGDFNLPVESTIYRSYWTQFHNAFREVGWGLGHTKRTALGPLTYGTRIDHVLVDSRWKAARCWLGQPIGSDHLPIVADLRLNAVAHVLPPDPETTASSLFR